MAHEIALFYECGLMFFFIFAYLTIILNMSSTLSRIIFVLIATACYSFVQAEVDGPKANFNDDLISQLEGNWSLTRKIRGNTVQNRVSAKWVLNHQFLQLHMKDVKEMPEYEAIVLIGYVHATQQYVILWSDTFGGKYSGKGIGNRKENSVEFKFDFSDGPFFNTFNWMPERKQWILRMESLDKNGNRRLFAEDTLVRE